MKTLKNLIAVPVEEFMPVLSFRSKSVFSIKILKVISKFCLEIKLVYHLISFPFYFSLYNFILTRLQAKLHGDNKNKKKLCFFESAHKIIAVNSIIPIQFREAEIVTFV